jgi:hypothetical protein
MGCDEVREVTHSGCHADLLGRAHPLFVYEVKGLWPEAARKDPSSAPLNRSLRRNELEP